MRISVVGLAAALMLAGCVSDGGYGGGSGYGSPQYSGYGHQGQPQYAHPARYRDDDDISKRKARRIAESAIEQRLGGRDFNVKEIDRAERDGRYVTVKGEGRVNGGEKKDFRVVVDTKTDRAVDVFVEDTVGRRRR